MEGLPASAPTSSSSSHGSIRPAIIEYAKRELIDVLDSVRGKKALVLDPTLSGPLSLVAEFSLLTEHGVEKIYHLQGGRLDTESKSVIYICRPRISNMKHIAEHIKAHIKAGIKIDYSVFFVPRRTLICERVLEDEGVYGDISMGEYHLDIIPLDDDVFSLELEGSFRELYLDGDPSCIYYTAKAIMKLQTALGIIPKIVGKGGQARLLVDMLQRMRRDLVANVDDPVASSRVFPQDSEIDSMIIIDRSVDLLTPMCTELTYEGLIDEIFNVKSTFVELDASLLGVPPATSASSTTAPVTATAKSRKVALNSNDKLFQQLRDLNFAVVGGLLSQVARRINHDYEERHNATTVTEIRNFVGRLGGLQQEHQSLRLHTNLAEQITKYTLDQDFNRMLEVQQNFVAGIISNPHIDYIEELIDKSAPLWPTMRLLCLYSLVNGGVKIKNYEFFKREVMHTYGFEHLLTFQNLSKTGLFKRQDSSSTKTTPSYAAIRKAFRLIVDDVNEHQPNDMSYVYSGYAPLSVRLVQAACQKYVGPVSDGKNVVGSQNVSWKGWEEALKLVPGATVEEVQTVGDGGSSGGLGGSVSKKSRGNTRLTLVVFLGGCTFTEISALRFLGQQLEGQREFVILTSNIINGSSLLKGMVDVDARVPLGTL
ncbi:hypothetical protein SmJEL517_g02554 [Synchytrium microbalum]|uniref:Sec1-like protein n=1 Tax=Synchytrium microbalum TaxID=1806994 RepID=A0A507C6T0_9FUNG|nr:uncharacterized protein SmJEL517_g02554 [Synchytrium microbalum]TPX34829.1 hypothetical protein SmJEL517_g02554 [Synchytrium microbalum]